MLDGPVADVLRRRVTINIPRRRRRRYVADAPAHDNGQFRLEIGAVLRKRNLYLPPVGKDRTGRFEPEERLFGHSFAGLAGVIGIVQADGDDLRGRHWGQRFQPLEGHRLFFKGGRSEDVAAHTEKLSVHNFGEKNLVILLKSANGCHKIAA